MTRERAAACLALAVLALIGGTAGAETTSSASALAAGQDTAQAVAVQITVPGQDSASFGVAVAPPDGSSAPGSVAYPGDGAVLSASSVSAAASAPGAASGDSASADLSHLSLFGGALTADVVAGRAHASGTSAVGFDGSTISGLVVDGVALGASPNQPFQLADWGHGVALEQSTSIGTSNHGAFAALDVTLDAPHDGLPAGTHIVVGAVEVTSFPPAAPPPPTAPPTTATVPTTATTATTATTTGTSPATTTASATTTDSPPPTTAPAGTGPPPSTAAPATTAATPTSAPRPTVPPPTRTAPPPAAPSTSTVASTTPPPPTTTRRLPTLKPPEPDPLPGGGGGAPVRRAPVGLPPPSLQPQLAPGNYVFPVFGAAAYSDTFGSARADVAWHHGDDIFAPLGTPLLAVADGTVFSVGWNTIGGNRLWLRDNQGNEFYYAHLSAFSTLAVDGARVHAGDVLGFVGNTGDAATTPYHLHFEVHPVGLLFLGYDGAVDPTSYLDSWRHLREVRLRPMIGGGPSFSPGAQTPPPGAILLQSNDISSASGLEPGSLQRALSKAPQIADGALLLPLSLSRG